jgi:hypothetical protein
MLEAVAERNTNCQLKFKIVMLTLQTASQIADKWRGQLSVDFVIRRIKSNRSIDNSKRFHLDGR